jgi:ankyrin repeat protein
MRCWIYMIVVTVLLWVGCTARPSEPLAIAASKGDLVAMDRLLAAGASADIPAALVWAARSGQPRAIDYLVTRGGDANARAGVNGWTVLMHAIHKNQPEAVRALLRDGARVNDTGSGGYTGLMMAAGYGYTQIVRILLEHGADPQLLTPSGENALDLAVEGVTDIDRFTFGTCQVETVRLLQQTVPDLRPRKTDLKKCG